MRRMNNNVTGGRALAAVALLTAGLLSWLTGSIGAVHAQSSTDLAIVGGTLIDGTGSPARPSMTVIVSGGRITKIGPSATTTPPAGAQVINAAGKYILPGLWDAHIHYRDYYAELLLTHGITSFVDWGGSPMDWTLAQRDAINKGKMYGPRIFTCGELIHDNASPEEARKEVRELGARGVNMISIGFGIRKDTMEAVIDEARKVGLPSSGYPIYAHEAIQAGITAIKHTYTVGAANITDPARFAELEQQLEIADEDNRDARLFLLSDNHDQLIKLMLEKKVVWVPTLVKDYKVTNDRRDEFELESFRMLANPNLQYLPVASLMPQVTNEFPTGIGSVASGRVGTISHNGTDWELYRRSYRNLQDLIKRLVGGGGHVLPGTAPHSFVVPGVALHQEFELLVDAGMTPAQVIQAATLWTAQFAHADKDLGSVTEGKIADLIVLKQNPLDDSRTTRSVETVIQGGRVQPTGYHWWYTNPLQRPSVGGAPGEGPRPPRLEAISPASIAEGSIDGTVSLTGKGFVPSSVAFFDRFPLETTFVSETALKAVLPSRFARTAGVYSLHVRTPRPGGGDSSSVPLTVRFP